MTDHKTVTMQEAHNASDMLNGCRNRMFVTDDNDEFEDLYIGAKYYLDLIYKANCTRLDLKRLGTSQPDKEKEAVKDEDTVMHDRDQDTAGWGLGSRPQYRSAEKTE